MGSIWSLWPYWSALFGAYDRKKRRLKNKYLICSLLTDLRNPFEYLLQNLSTAKPLTYGLDQNS